ncbi:MAG: sugar phosphate isomerase/epimerase [Phycisphaerales bacterium]|nr:sugar phosphate isomerase/epimerase [Phycisphaerales bacterium]
MARPVTLFTGQWADVPFEQMCAKAQEFGYDGLELACWGDHFDVERALKDKGYCKRRWQILLGHDLDCHSISSHLVGQAICDNIDSRHKAILPPEVWGDGQPEGVRKRAARRMIDTAKVCRKFMDARPETVKRQLPAFTPTVNGFTGSSIWHAIYAFPPTDQKYWQRGFDDFARRFTPILNEFEKVDVNFGLEVHPTEIAFDIETSRRAIDAIKGHRRFGFNYDPSHLAYQGVDYVKFIRTFADRIYHVHMKDVWWGHGDGTVGVFGGFTSWADPKRYWDFRSLGHGDVNFEEIIVALNDIGYAGPLSVEWEDARMDREYGAAEAAAFVREVDFPRSNISFDSQFDR